MNKDLKNNFNPQAQAGIPVPSWTETEGGMQRSYDPFSRLLKERQIFLNGPIDDNMAISINTQLRLLDTVNTGEPIELYINSPGGSIAAGLSIFDTMNSIQSPVATIGMGMCASMGSFLLSAGHPGMRYATPNCEVMVHQPRIRGGGDGVQTSTDLGLNAEHIDRIRQRMEMYYAHFMGLDTEKHADIIDRLMERDTFVNASTAVKLGLIDHIQVPDKAEKLDYFKAQHALTLKKNEAELNNIGERHKMAVIKDVIKAREEHLASKGKLPAGPRP